MNPRTPLKHRITFALLVFSFPYLSSASSILQNSGFETQSTNYPGNSANWYAGTYAANPSGTISANVSTDAAASGTYGFLLHPVSVSGNHSAAWVGSDRSPLPGGSLTLSFQFKTISATGGTWSDYKISFFDASNTEITAARITSSTGYSWGSWTTKTQDNIVPPTNAVSVVVTLSAYASGGTGGEALWAFDNVSLRSAATKTVLLDIGRSNTDGGWYGGSTPTSPDSNGNYWNTLDLGKYAGAMTDKTNGATSWGAGFINTNSPSFGWYNGPAGDNSVPWSINEAALGDLGNKDAAFDYVIGTNVRMSLNGLTSGKKYRLNFYCSRRWAGDGATTISVYSANTFDSSVKLAEDTVANRSATQGWVHNADTLLTLDNLTPTGTSLFINIVGASGGEGVLNSMSIQELDAPIAADTTPPVIVLAGNNPETVIWGSSYSDAGASATDSGVSVTVSANTSAVNTAVLGSYTVTYTATDAANNIASTNRTVLVTLPANADVAGADGLSPLLRYALGASNPSASVAKPAMSSDANDLILTALVRTSGVTAVGQVSTNLSSANAGFADLATNPNGVTAADQTNLLPGTERREFRTSKTGDRKFLRLKVSAP